MVSYLLSVTVAESDFYKVLILIVMDNGLLQIVTLDPNKGLKSS